MTLATATMTELTPKMVAVAELVGRGKSRYQAAKEVGIATNTVYTWDSHPLFQERVAQAQREYIAELKAGVLEVAKRAMEIQMRTLDDETSKKAQEQAHAIVLRLMQL